ncbi:MAG: hypothetical protein HQ483_02845 [Rhodospirillales bacterium]|nr:hypothetical protein [Rhodospirillales bacterium]
MIEGLLMENGWGTNRDIANAIELYQQEALKGSPGSMGSIGWLLEQEPKSRKSLSLVTSYFDREAMIQPDEWSPMIGYIYLMNDRIDHAAVYYCLFARKSPTRSSDLFKSLKIRKPKLVIDLMKHVRSKNVTHACNGVDLFSTLN